MCSLVLDFTITIALLYMIEWMHMRIVLVLFFRIT